MLDIPIAQAPPMLSNPPAVVLLALVVGLGAYLRQVAENASKMLDELEEGKHEKLYPPDTARTILKMHALNNTRNQLNGIVAPAMILLGILTAARLVLQSILLLPNVQRCLGIFLDPFFRWFDFFAFSFLLIAFTFLGVMHFSARATDKMIRELPKSESKTQD